jgi:hypothetical protein
VVNLGRSQTTANSIKEKLEMLVIRETRIKESTTKTRGNRIREETDKQSKTPYSKGAAGQHQTGHHFNRKFGNLNHRIDTIRRRYTGDHRSNRTDQASPAKLECCSLYGRQVVQSQVASSQAQNENVRLIRNLDYIILSKQLLNAEEQKTLKI